MSPTHVNIIHKFYQYYQDYQHGLSRYTRVYKKVKDYVEAVGAGSAVKKDDCSQLKLPELGKLEAGATSPLSDNFTLLSIEVNDDQLAITYSMAMRLVEMIINFKIFDLLDN